MQWNLITLRRQHNLNQSKMSDILDISHDTYGRKERGQLQFNSDEMFFLSDYFGEPIEKIFLPRNCINNAIKSKEENE